MTFRVPLPYKAGEHHYLGNCEERLRSEAATYIWINKNCPEVPTAVLRGFGVPDGASFLEPRSATFWQRLKWSVWRFCRSLYGQTDSCDYIPQARTTFIDHGYMLIDWIDNEDEQVLSNVFRKPHIEEQVQNLYQSMAKIIVSLAKELENLNVLSGVARNTTYTSADTFCLDLLDGHDNRLRHQANAALDNAKSQAVDLVLMRSMLSHFTDRSLRDGPYVMHLTDMHISNIFLDKDWNIKHIIDLEWACSVPLEHALAPCWLTDNQADELTGAEYEEFEKHYRLLTDCIRKQETDALIQYNGTAYSLAATMDRVLEKKHYWYLIALRTLKGLFNIFSRQLQPMYDDVPRESLYAAVAPFWTPGLGSDEETAPMTVAEGGYDEIAMLLLDWGADPAAQHYSGSKRDARAVRANALGCGPGLSCVLKLLLERGANPTYVVLAQGNRPLDTAIQKNHYWCVRLLFDAEHE
ncbi:hypothetical protein BJX70DRAFT_400402 [Aspergillus crustosus]